MLLVPPFPTGILRYWKAGLMIVLALAVAVQTVRLNHTRDNLEREKAARVADRIAYKAAQDKAREQMKAENRRIEAEQEAKTNEIKSRYERDLARLRAGGLRKDLKSPARPDRAPQDNATACRDDAQNMCIDRRRVLQAAETELSHHALIDYVNGLLKSLGQPEVPTS